MERKITSTTSFSLDLDKIPESAIKEFPRKDGTTGKSVNLTALNFNTEDEYGKSASVQLSRTKAERDEGKKSVYVGNGWHNPTKVTADDTPF
jgi:hypothetical protein|tara:strand:+ start:97 stop:372 length:276 start_codon:yes stop_codon:yes gene_type:complete